MVIAGKNKISLMVEAYTGLENTLSASGSQHMGLLSIISHLERKIWIIQRVVSVVNRKSKRLCMGKL